MERSELFYVKKCPVCNELTIAGAECIHCKLDDVLHAYNNKLIELNNKLLAQNKLLESGVVVEQDDYAEMVSVIRDLVGDIETPHRLGVADRINPNWEALNRAKRLIIKWDKDSFK